MTTLTPADGFAVVTGAGSGLGRALATELIHAGFTVVGIDQQANALKETCGALGDKFQPVTLDISNSQTVAQMFAERVQLNGPLAILINNAAVHLHRDFLHETPETFDETMGLNFTGALNCSHAAVQNMVGRGAGRVLTLTSFAYLNPAPCSAAYSVSRGAVRVLTQAMIADLGDRFPGIVINEWIPDGVPIEEAAVWGARLAQMADPDLTGSLFAKDAEVLPPRRLKGKIKDLLLFRKPNPRRI